MDRKQAIHAIRDAAPILEMVAEEVKLRKTGNGWMGGPCPIHKGGSRTPCLSVLPEKGSWHCFSCGEGGDAFDWLEKVHGMSFEEALEDLSKRTGIELPQRGDRNPDGPEERILRALSMAQDFYTTRLQECPQALAYLTGRGITAKTIADEGLGYAPDGWETTIHHLQGLGVKAEISELAGIASRSERGNPIDFLRDRITVPIMDPRGRVIAFGGRAMPGAHRDSPKYLNTKETGLFKKSETVFHLHRARAFLREEGALMVEGYFDVIALCQEGIQNAVAPLGTALTDGHLRQLGRWTKRLTLGFDGDKAGWEATSKALKKALPEGFDVRLLHIPDGEDPDTWARGQGGPTAKRLIAAAPDWATFALDRAKEGKDLRRIEDRLAAAREVSEWIAYLPTGRQDEVRVAAAHELNLPAASIKAAPRPSAAPQASPQVSPQPTTPQAMDDAVQALLAITGKGGAFIQWVAQLPKPWWEWRPGAGVLETLLDAEGDPDLLGPRGQAALREAEARAATVAQVDPKRLVLRLEKEYLQRETMAVARSLAAHATDEAIAGNLQAELTELRARMARLTRGITR